MCYNNLDGAQFESTSHTHTKTLQKLDYVCSITFMNFFLLSDL